MNIKKLALAFIIFLLNLPCYSITKPHIRATMHTGIAFVHGTNDHRLDAIGVYWKQELIDAVANKLPNPENVLVVHCDFRQYMWDKGAAGCLAEQLTQFIDDKKINDLIVITHSDGGNVMRWILSNPSYDARYPKIINSIRWVNALAPSSGGTVLADSVIDGTTFEAALGWLLGYKTNSVKQQRIGDMAIFNNNLLDGGALKPNLARPFYTIVGTDVSMSPLNSDSYCGGYWYNVALKVTKLYLDKCADGFLSCNSQTAAGDVWFYDYEKLDGKKHLTHNQSRNQCFGIEQLLTSDI